MRLFFRTQRSLTFLYGPVILIMVSIWKMPPDAEKAMRIPSVMYGEMKSNAV